ncbi:phosphatidylinositol 3,4,5-trisphosphate 3-phosphatase and protein-tyrosine-phosphatase PTEN1 isoform X2, partial [Tanacetum coccineum]
TPISLGLLLASRKSTPRITPLGSPPRLLASGFPKKTSKDEDYDPSNFNNLVERFPFDHNHVPSLQMIKELCESVHSWLSSDPKNTVVIHCMAGKGRTGLTVSSYLTYTGMLAEEALQVYADKRTTNNLGITRHNSEIEGSDENSSYDFYFDERIKVNGDLCVTFYEKNIGGRLFYACFNTAFIENNLLHFSITKLDKVGTKAKSIAGPKFRVELLFGPDNPNDGEDGCNSDC